MKLMTRPAYEKVVDEISQLDWSGLTQDDLVVLKDLIEAGRVCPAIDRTYPLTEAAEAVRYVGTGQARAKVVIKV